MENVIIKVNGMSCGHCVKAVEGAVAALPGVAGVLVDLARKTVAVEHEPKTVSLARIKAAIDGQGFETE